MDSIKELQEEVRKLKIEKETLENKIIQLQTKTERENKILQDALLLVEQVPQNSEIFLKQTADEFKKSNTVIKAEEFLTNKKLNKIFSLLNKFYIDEENNIFVDKIHVGHCTDDRFKKFLEKTIEVLPFLVRLYIRYHHFTDLVLVMDNYKYLGKEIHKRMENIGNR